MLLGYHIKTPTRPLIVQHYQRLPSSIKMVKHQSRPRNPQIIYNVE
jgi:hypothetical protein